MFDFLLGNDLLSGIIAFILVLIPAVFIHELGHFIAAKAVGITILEFGIGMPPRAARLFTAGGTDYTLNWLPLGGFVRPLGEGIVSQMGESETSEDRLEAERRGIRNPKSVFEAKPGARILFMAAGSLANFLMALVLFTIVALLGLPETVGARTNLYYVAPDTALFDAGLRSGDVIEAVDGVVFDTTPDLIDLLYGAPRPITLTIRRADVAEPLTITVDPGLRQEPDEGTVHPIIGHVAPNSPADRAGLRPGDLILMVNGQSVADVPDLQEYIRANLGEEARITYWRDGITQDVTLVPRVNPPAGEGAIGVAFAEDARVTLDTTAGIVYGEGFPQQQLKPQSLGVAVPYAFNQFGEVLRVIGSIPGQLLQGTAGTEMLRPIGPVGVSQAGAEFLRESVSQDRPALILNFIALISISLGLTNLLPIPALDGGRILFVLIEIIRGRPIAPEREGMVHLVGLALLLSLMVVVVVNDIVNPVTELLR